LSSSRRSNVTGRCPEGFTAPNRISANAVPPSWPGYQACNTAGTWSSHGVNRYNIVREEEQEEGLAKVKLPTF
jgi:hypothetical protein